MEVLRSCERIRGGKVYSNQQGAGCLRTLLMIHVFVFCTFGVFKRSWITPRRCQRYIDCQHYPSFVQRVDEMVACVDKMVDEVNHNMSVLFRCQQPLSTRLMNSAYQLPPLQEKTGSKYPLNVVTYDSGILKRIANAVPTRNSNE